MTKLYYYFALLKNYISYTNNERTKENNLFMIFTSMEQIS